MSNFRHFATFQYDNSPDGASTGATDWQDRVKQVPCNIHDVSAKETFRGVQLESSTTHVVEMRYLTNYTIDATLRIKDGRNRIMNIEKVMDKTGRERFLYILCHQVVS